MRGTEKKNLRSTEIYEWSSDVKLENTYYRVGTQLSGTQLRGHAQPVGSPGDSHPLQHNNNNPPLMRVSPQELQWPGPTFCFDF